MAVEDEFDALGKEDPANALGRLVHGPGGVPERTRLLVGLLFGRGLRVEVLLEQGNEIIARDFIQNNLQNNLYISDFTLHSIGVVLLRFKRLEDYSKFIDDVIEECEVQILSLGNNDLKGLASIQKKFNLDFADA